MIALKKRESMVMIGRRAMLPVSLSSRKFSKAFLRSLLVWLRTRGGTGLEIVVFDELEAINYRVFRRLPLAQGRAIARRRGTEFVRMCEKVRNSLAIDEGVPVDRVLLESTWAGREAAEYREIAETLRAAYKRGGRLRRDVHEQVRRNLTDRAAIYGPALVEENLDTLAEYLLAEVAFFCGYLRRNCDVVEVYPGSTLELKQRLFRGEYREEVVGCELERAPDFVDVSFLVEARDSREEEGHLATGAGA